MKKFIILTIIIIVIAIVAAIFMFWQNSQTKPPKYTGPIETITLGARSSILPSVIWVADNNGYFKEYGLDVKIKEFDAGATALSTMLNEGSLDMVAASQLPVVLNSFNKDNYAIIAAMAYSDNDVKMLGRQDKGIKTPADLIGKKIGYTEGSAGHFFLGSFFSINGLNISDVKLVNLKTTELAQALVDGKVDAIASWEPYITTAKNYLGDKAILFDSEGVYREDHYFIAMKDFIKNHPETVERFLRAIEKGEEFIRQNREESISIVSNLLETDRKIIAQCWNMFEFNLVLDQTMLLSLEDVARWSIKNKLTDKTKVPNYLDYIYIDALEKINPKAVIIIR